MAREIEVDDACVKRVVGKPVKMDEFVGHWVDD